MLKELDIQEACDTIYRFADANRVDPLNGIELMVKHFRQLSPKELRAIRVFMDESKQVDNKFIKSYNVV